MCRVSLKSMFGFVSQTAIALRDTDGLACWPFACPAAIGYDARWLSQCQELRG